MNLKLYAVLKIFSSSVSDVFISLPFYNYFTSLKHIEKYLRTQVQHYTANSQHSLLVCI